MTSTPIHGHCDGQFKAVYEAFAQNLAEGLDHGAAIAMVLDGHPVINLWGGTMDAAQRAPWREDTLVNVWSVTKGVVATAVAMAVERGQLRYDAPIAKVWPEFAANGKEAITLDQVMSHRAGLNGFNEPLDEEMLFDWEGYTARLAAMKPNWAPGTACAYHALTYGHLAAEPLRRATGKGIGAFVREDIVGLLGADFLIGVPESEDHRCSHMFAEAKTNDWLGAVLQSPFPQACKNPTPRAEAANDRRWRAAEVPGGNGHATALGLAKIYGDLTSGASRLLSSAGLAEAIRPRFRGTDESFGMPTAFAAGFGLQDSSLGVPVAARHFGHNGWGGSMAFGDPDARLGFAYVTNTMRGFDDIDPRRSRLYKAVYGAL